MTKDRNHDYLRGRTDAINEILNSISSKTQDSVLAAVYLTQSGGKYCTFDCPVCSSDSAMIKMTQNSGWCDKCDTTFQNFSAKHTLATQEGMQHPDMIGFIEFYRA